MDVEWSLCSLKLPRWCKRIQSRCDDQFDLCYMFMLNESIWYSSLHCFKCNVTLELGCGLFSCEDVGDDSLIVLCTVLLSINKSWKGCILSPVESLGVVAAVGSCGQSNDGLMTPGRVSLWKLISTANKGASLTSLNNAGENQHPQHKTLGCR